jgi:hypothetical protein
VHKVLQCQRIPTWGQLELVVQALGVPAPEVHVDQSRIRPDDPPEIRGDHRLITQLLGWQPEIDLETARAWAADPDRTTYLLDVRTLEEYAAEQTGRSKKPESLSWFIGYMKSLKEPSGRIRLDIGNPVVIDEAPGPDDKRALEKIAFAVAVEANRVTPLTVTSVMCLILLGTAPRGATAAELLATIGAVTDWARARGIRISSELESRDDKALSATVDTLVESGRLA